MACNIPITANDLRAAMDFDLGPFFDGPFESAEVESIHSLWREGYEKIREAQRRIRELCPKLELEFMPHA